MNSREGKNAQRKAPRSERGASRPEKVSPLMRQMVDEMVDEYLAGSSDVDFTPCAARELGTDRTTVDLALCELVRRYRGAYCGLKAGVLGAVEYRDRALRERAA